MSRAVRKFFNHEVHIKEHNRWRKSQTYEQMPLEAQALIDMHVEEHEMHLMMSMMSAQGIAPAAPGAPRSAGTPQNPERLEKRVGNGELIGRSMQGGAPSG
jgi:hypothetical protein